MNLGKKQVSHFLVSTCLTMACAYILTSPCQVGHAMTQRPKISFKRHSVDFGRVKQGQTLKHRFHFENTGKGLLKILGTHSACGCTSAIYGEKESFSPGDKGSIDISFDTKDFLGGTSKVVTVMTNESLAPYRTLRISADIEADYLVDPPILKFGQKSAEKLETLSLKIAPVGTFTLTPPIVRVSSDYFSVKQQQLPGGYQLDVTFNSHSNPEKIHETLSILTNSKSHPRFEVHLIADANGPITYEPSYLEFGSIEKQSQSTRVITLKSKAPLEINEAQVDLNINGQKAADTYKFIRWECHQKSEDKYELVVDLKNAQKTSGSIYGRLALTTKTKIQNKISIDFYGFFR